MTVILQTAQTMKMLASDANDVSAQYIFCKIFETFFHKDSCNDGELRLVGGGSPHEGHVEMCLGQRWGSVNNEIWSTANIEVVCRQLGYTQGTLYSVYFLISHNNYTQHIMYAYSRRGIQWVYTYYPTNWTSTLQQCDLLWHRVKTVRLQL